MILFLVDVREGVLPLDEHVAKRLRALDKPVLLVANKCDVPELASARRTAEAAMMRLTNWDIAIS